MTRCCATAWGKRRWPSCKSRSRLRCWRARGMRSWGTKRLSFTQLPEHPLEQVMAALKGAQKSRIEVSGARLEHDAQGGLMRQRRLVHAAATQGVVDIGDGHNAGCQGYIVA